MTVDDCAVGSAVITAEKSVAVPNYLFTAKDELRRMKMVPAVFRGTGAFVRKNLHDTANYSDLYPQMGWLIGKWHNALYGTLEPDLKEPPTQG